jgi:hypothetical protein
MNPSGGGCAATVHIRPRRARLRGRPSGLKGRSAIATATGLRPALDPGASAAPSHAAAQAGPAALPARAARRSTTRTQDPYKSSLYGLRGLPSVAIQLG